MRIHPQFMTSLHEHRLLSLMADMLCRQPCMTRDIHRDDLNLVGYVATLGQRIFPRSGFEAWVDFCLCHASIATRPLAKTRTPEQFWDIGSNPLCPSCIEHRLADYV